MLHVGVWQQVSLYDLIHEKVHVLWFFNTVSACKIKRETDNTGIIIAVVKLLQRKKKHVVARGQE